MIISKIGKIFNKLKVYFPKQCVHSQLENFKESGNVMTAATTKMSSVFAQIVLNRASIRVIECIFIIKKLMKLAAIVEILHSLSKSSAVIIQDNKILNLSKLLKLFQINFKKRLLFLFKRNSLNIFRNYKKLIYKKSNNLRKKL